jgi:uncharacterized protein (TIGR00730 family)
VPEDSDFTESKDRPWAVCVYCASGPTHPELLALANGVGHAIADRGWTLVSGGGNVSAMGALAEAARAHRGHTVGVIPKALVHREVADVDADELIVTDTMRERKQVMEERADAFIVLPGGIGTLEEFFEAWTAGYLGMHDKPCSTRSVTTTGCWSGSAGWRVLATLRLPRWTGSSWWPTSTLPWRPAPRAVAIPLTCAARVLRG